LWKLAKARTRRFRNYFADNAESSPLPYKLLKTNSLDLYDAFIYERSTAKYSDCLIPLLHRFAATCVTKEYLLPSRLISTASYASVLMFPGNAAILVTLTQ